MANGGYTRLREIDLTKYLDTENKVRARFTALVTEVEDRQAKKEGGANSILIKAIDGDSEREIRAFDNLTILKTKIKPGCVYDFTVDVKPYDKAPDKISCIYYDSVATRSGLKPIQFRSCVENIDQLAQRFIGYLNYYSGTLYGQVAINIMQPLMEVYKSYPAGSSMHHTELGGLLFHSLSVADLCYNEGMTINNTYGAETVNMALLVCTALIHDCGKPKEYRLNDAMKVEYSEYSALENHLTMGADMILMTARDMGFKNVREVDEMRHLILSHHGKREYGCAIEPNCIEARILADADQVDAVIWRHKKNVEKLQSGCNTSVWEHGTMEVYYKPISITEHMQRMTTGFMSQSAAQVAAAVEQDNETSFTVPQNDGVFASGQVRNTGVEMPSYNQEEYQYHADDANSNVEYNGNMSTNITQGYNNNGEWQQVENDAEMPFNS